MAAKPEGNSLIDGKLFGIYRCPHCNNSWRSLDASHSYKTCGTCGETAKRQHSRPLEHSDIPDNKRLFGKYRCTQCNKVWQSANAWKGNTQMCKECKIAVLPHYLNYRQRKNDDETKSEKPHLTHLCQKCKKLGFNCRLLTTTPKEDYDVNYDVYNKTNDNEDNYYDDYDKTSDNEDNYYDDYDDYRYDETNDNEDHYYDDYDDYDDYDETNDHEDNYYDDYDEY